MSAMKTKDAEERLKKLMAIKQAVEREINLGEKFGSPIEKFDELRKNYRIESLWVIEGDKETRLGDMDYSRELGEYRKLKKEFANTSSLRLQRDGSKCYILEKDKRIFIFSSSLDLTSTDIFILLKEVNNMLVERISQTFLEGKHKYRKDKS